MMLAKWYQIENRADKTAKISIYERIGKDFWTDEGVSAKQFIEELNDLDVETIDLHINSPGGSVFEGNAIYNALKAHSAEIRVKIDGLAASIASVIAMAGDSVEMPENAMLMIHDPRGGAWGSVEDLLSVAEALEKIKKGIVTSYKSRSNLKRQEISDLMSKETWITADEAKKWGFADTITERVEISACIDKDFSARFKNVPEKFIKADQAGQKPKQEEKEMKITLELLNKDYPDLVAQIADAARKEGMDAGRSEGAEAERARISAVREQTIEGHEDLINAMMFDGVTTGEQAAVKILAAEKQVREAVKGKLAKDAPKAAAAVAAPAVENSAEKEDESLPLEERAEATWEKDAELRKEFDGQFETYLAYRKADEKGCVRVLKK